MPRSLSQPQKGSVMSSRTILSLAGVAILGLACVSTDAFARGRAGGFHAGGDRAAGFHGGGVRAANFSRGVAWRGGAVRGGAYRGAALRGGAYRAAAWRGGVYRGDYWRPGWGAAAVGAAAVGAAAVGAATAPYYYGYGSQTCGYYPNPPCY